MNKKLRLFIILFISIIIFLPFQKVSAWQYRTKWVKLSTFTTAPGGRYHISNSVSHNFYQSTWLNIHEVYQGNEHYQGYCLHAGKSVKEETVYEHKGFADLYSTTTGQTLSASQQELLKNILASGYQNGNNNIEGTIVVPNSGGFKATCRDANVCRRVLVTQILVWEVMENARHNYSYDPQNGVPNNTYNYVSSDPALLSIYKNILDQARDLSGEGNVPAAFGQTFTLSWNDSTKQYESGSIDVGSYNIETSSLPSGVSISDKNGGKVQLHSKNQIENPVNIKFKLVKGSTVAGSSSFRWFRFATSGLQDVLMGNYQKVFSRELKIKTELGKFKIAKKDNDTGKDLKGAKFNVFKCTNTTGDCDLKNVVYSVDLSNNSLSSEYKLLKSGIYLFRETQIPPGYEKVDDFYINFEIKNGKTTAKSDAKFVSVKEDNNSSNVLILSIYNESKKYSINKINGSTKEVVKGTHFKIKDSNGNYVKFNLLKNGCYVYDSNGTHDELYDANKSIYKFSLLPKGEYIIEETGVVYPYTLSSTKEERETKIKIDTNYDLFVYNYTTKKYERASNASVTVNNYKTKVEIIKKGKNNVKLPGVTFELYNSDKSKQINLIKTGEGIYQYPEGGTGTPIQLITNASGKITINYLPVGTYYLKEVKTVDGYVIDPTVEWKEIKVVVTRSGQTSPAQILEWPNAKGEFCFYKIDEDGNYLTDGKFKIQSYNEKNSTYEDVSLIFHENENNYTFDTTGKSDIYTFSPVANGETCFVDVNAKGKYRVVEIEAPEGFVLPKVSETNADFVVNENGYVVGTTTIINKKVTVGEGAEAQAELIINISTGQQRIRYAIIITVLVVAIAGLIILNKKMGKK